MLARPAVHFLQRTVRTRRSQPVLFAALGVASIVGVTTVMEQPAEAREASSARGVKPGERHREPLYRIIDHTCLKADATPSDIEKLCREAAEHDFASVCVNAAYVSHAVNCLTKMGKLGRVKVCATVGFPLGASGGDVKAYEAVQAILSGASEIDVVIPVGLLKAGRVKEVKEELRLVADACRRHRALLKVIIETCLLTDQEKRTACLAAMEAGALYVKTSTGFSTGGATVEDVKLMHRCMCCCCCASLVAPLGGKVKASGGIRTREFALQLKEAGASRIGASASVAICKEEGPSQSEANGY